ncbi:MAG: hypothetical protein ACYC1U_01605 [Candidatus Aquicultorales bacterium]
MSLIKSAAKMMAGAAVGAIVVASVNPELRRAAVSKAFGLFDLLLDRANKAFEAGRDAAEAREKELEKLLEVESGLGRESEPFDTLV